jgi:multidrug efflux pump subunit AcrA (membrane-fusion protein)
MPNATSMPALIPAEVQIGYARATGYIATRDVDIGSRVHRGDVLVVVAAPDLDQQLAEARAELVQPQALPSRQHTRPVVSH